MELLSRPLNWTRDDMDIADLIIRISNIMYNDTGITVLPLDDGIYDQLIVAYKKYNPNYQVGATPIQFDTEFDQKQYNENTEKKLMYHTITDQERESKLYINNIHAQHIPLLARIRPDFNVPNNLEPITKRLIDTQHKYPELVGTLDKCKFVLNNDAKMAEAFDNPSVAIFERDFIHPCISSGIIGTNEVFEMVCELKYDGVSVEAEVCGDTIITALSRGDTADNVATDLTPIFKYYKFYNASKVPKDITFGIKFEAIITRSNLERLGQLRGKEYKNARNAIIGLLGASDAYNFVDYITLIPIATSLDMPRVDELNFLNKYYNTGEYNRYISIRGNYQEILFHVKQFTESAEVVRSILPYMIDGVVISFTDPNKIRMLGRVNSVNKYQMAIKFNPREVRTIFLGYTYNIGKSGEVIPMVHFKPAEFIGTIHTKQTIHSFQRFKELELVKGQEIDVKYVNDVISYITKPDTPHNRQLAQIMQPEEFITHCPYCGSPIEISPTYKSARCPNPLCHERQIYRMVDMISRLGFKDFSEETVRTLNLTDFSRLITMYEFDELEPLLGPVTADKFRLCQMNLINNPIEDYRLMSALGFEGMADEKWKKILKVYDLPLLFAMTLDQIRFSLNSINGIGIAIINAVIEGFKLYHTDIELALSKLNIIHSKNITAKPKVVITGFRDPMVVDIINSCGYDCSDKYSVTKDTAIVVTNDVNSRSGKIDKARKYGIPVMSVEQFYKEHNVQFQRF